MANPYDVNVIFADMEQKLVKSFRRNMSKYKNPEEMWQALKLKDLQAYRREVAQTISGATSQAKSLSKLIIKDDFLAGADKVDAFMKKFKLKMKVTSSNDFFELNRDKLNALLEAVYGDLDNAAHAAYRMMDDVYRQTVFKSQIAFNSGVLTMDQAIDSATKDFLDKGVNCIQYSNGARVNTSQRRKQCLHEHR